MTDWVQTQADPNRDTRYDRTVALPNGDILLCGGREDSVGNIDLTVKRIDPLGNLVWSQIYSKPGAPGNLLCDAVALGPSGNIVIGCDATGNATTYDTYLIKVDQNGNKLAETTIDLYDWDLLAGLEIGTSGNVVFTSISTDADQYQASKLDSNLNLTWTTYLGNPGQSLQSAAKPVITANGDVLVPGIVSDGTQRDARISRLSATGTVLYERTFGDPADDDGYPTVFQSTSANTYFAYTRNAYGIDDQVRMHQLDQLGNTQWTIADADISSLTIRQLDSGDLVVCGPTFAADDTSSQKFARVTETGVVVWTTSLVSPNVDHNWVRGMRIGPDGLLYSYAHMSEFGLDGATWFVNCVTSDGFPVFQWRLPYGNEQYNFPGDIEPLDGGAVIVAGEVGTTTDDDAQVRRLQAEFNVFPLSANIRLGRLNSGNLGSLVNNDNNDYELCKFIVPNQATPPINVEFDSLVPAGYPANSLTFNVVGRASTTGLQQNVELWNWTTGQWDSSTLQNMALTEQTSTTVALPASHIQAGTRFVRARIRVAVSGLVLTNSWCVRFDQATWLVRP